MRRWHINFCLPCNFLRMVDSYLKNLPNIVRPTYHAAAEMLEDPFGPIPVPYKTDLVEGKLIEIYENEVINRGVIRVKHMGPRDYTFVVEKSGLLITAWSNNKNDNHVIDEKQYYGYG